MDSETPSNPEAGAETRRTSFVVPKCAVCNQIQNRSLLQGTCVSCREAAVRCKECERELNAARAQVERLTAEKAAAEAQRDEAYDRGRSHELIEGAWEDIRAERDSLASQLTQAQREAAAMREACKEALAKHFGKLMVSPTREVLQSALSSDAGKDYVPRAELAQAQKERAEDTNYHVEIIGRLNSELLDFQLVQSHWEDERKELTAALSQAQKERDEAERKRAENLSLCHKLAGENEVLEASLSQVERKHNAVFPAITWLAGRLKEARPDISDEIMRQIATCEAAYESALLPAQPEKVS